MWQLVRKELRSMLPFLTLAMLLPFLSFVFELATDPVHVRPFATTYTDYVTPASEGAAIVLLFALALTSGLLVREHDDGTMEFLDSLPVSRTRVFLVKVAMALFVMTVFTGLDMSTTVFLHAVSRNSLDDDFHLRFLAQAACLRTAQVVVFLSIGLALSFLRRFGWLLAGLLVWLFLLVQQFAPGIQILNVLSLVEPHFVGSRLLIPYRPLAVQLGIAAVLLLTSYGLFLGTGDRLIRGYRKLAENRAGAALLVLAGILVVVVGGSLFVYAALASQADQADRTETGVKVTYPSWDTATSQTRWYRFVYPANLSGRAANLVARADETHDKVRTFFSAEPGEPIVVDAASLLPRHAGVAFWDTIRLNLSGSDDDATLQSILGHETTHVFLERLSDRRLSEQFNSTRFFHEGVATYVEYHLFEPRAGLAGSRSVAAVMRSRDEVDVRELVDSQLLSGRRDTNLVYPLGEVFVAALVERYGSDAVGKVARALVRDDAPRGLVGQELWRDTLQSCGYNFDDVLDQFYAILDEEVQKNSEWIASIPRLRSEWKPNARRFEVSVQPAWVPDWDVVCRLRPRLDSPDSQYVAAPEIGGTFVVQQRDFPGPTVWYQVGLRDKTGREIWEPWLEVATE